MNAQLDQEWGRADLDLLKRRMHVINRANTAAATANRLLPGPIGERLARMCREINDMTPWMFRLCVDQDLELIDSVIALGEKTDLLVNADPYLVAQLRAASNLTAWRVALDTLTAVTPRNTGSQTATLETQGTGVPTPGAVPGVDRAEKPKCTTRDESSILSSSTTNQQDGQHPCLRWRQRLTRWLAS